MEPILWDSLLDICRREQRNLNDVVTLVDRKRGDSGLTAAIRVFLLSYYRRAMAADSRPALGFRDDGGPGTFDRAIAIFEPTRKTSGRPPNPEDVEY